jgi:hypothetical protein
MDTLDLSIREGKITAITAISDPDRLHELQLARPGRGKNKEQD